MNINELINMRRTIRKFRQVEISEDLLLKYVDAARVAPSGGNLQPLKFAIINSKDKVEEMFQYVKWAGYLAPHYNPKEGERPTAYIVVLADLSVRKSGYDMDVGAAVENIILSSFDDGVGSCWIASVDREKTAELLNLPDNLIVSCVVALGYPDEQPKAVELTDEDIKYYLDNDNTLCVPKRSISDVLYKCEEK